MNHYEPHMFKNRELSWMQFNERVLEEARDPSNPLFERLKFLSITASNLDEFIMIRVASLKDMVHARYDKADLAGLTPTMQLERLNEVLHRFAEEQYATWNDELMPLLFEHGLIVVEHHEDLNEKDAEFLEKYFRQQIYPVLTPMAVDSSRPFPLIYNMSLNIGALLQKKENTALKPERSVLLDENDAPIDKDSPEAMLLLKEKREPEVEFATVQVPGVLPRFVALPDDGSGKTRVIFLEEVIESHMDQLFLSYDILCSCPYRIIRNADLSIDEDDASDLLEEIERQVKRRQWGEVIRLEVEAGIDERLYDVLKDELEMEERDIFYVNGPLDLTFLMKLYKLPGFEAEKEEPYEPVWPKDLEPGEDLFDQIKRHDILLSHPYESFEPVVDFVRKAAADPKVLAIKQTLYRVSGNSPIIQALAEAADNGKQVTVLVELKARFDEEHNIAWSKMLEKAGCHVIYGLVGLKTHSKITLVVRLEDEGIVRYVHLGTGNYNDSTAKLYTDLGLFTSNLAIGEDATAVFNMLSGYSEPASWNKLSLAPIWLRDRFLKLIRRETEIAREGGRGRIVAKMNSLCDKEIIEALYDASAAGVEISLIVRGICCLRVGIPGISDTITVRSIVGRFLEHSRIFYFYNGGNEEYYMSSADWMPRNMDRRVEILFPVEDPKLCERLKAMLVVLLKDNVKARELGDDGLYHRAAAGDGQEIVCAQDYFCRKAEGK